jgi:hypothetical protein
MPRERVAQGSNGPEKLWIAASPWVPIQEIPISEIPILEIPILEIPILETLGCKGVSVGGIGVSTQISQSASQDLRNTLHNLLVAPAPDGRCQNGKKWNHGLPIHPSPRHYFR